MFDDWRMYGMRKHGIRMELLGGTGLLLLALASDANMLSALQVLYWELLCIGVMLLGYRFTLPYKRSAAHKAARANVPARAATCAPSPSPSPSPFTGRAA